MSHIYRNDETVNFWDNQVERYYIPSSLQKLIKDCIQEMKERRLEYAEKKNKLKFLEQVHQETRVFTYLLHNPKAMEELNALQISKMTNANESIVQQIID